MGIPLSSTIIYVKSKKKRREKFQLFPLKSKTVFFSLFQIIFSKTSKVKVLFFLSCPKKKQKLKKLCRVSLDFLPSIAINPTLAKFGVARKYKIYEPKCLVYLLTKKYYSKKIFSFLVTILLHVVILQQYYYIITILQQYYIVVIPDVQ